MSSILFPFMSVIIYVCIIYIECVHHAYTFVLDIATIYHTLCVQICIVHVQYNKNCTQPMRNHFNCRSEAHWQPRRLNKSYFLTIIIFIYRYIVRICTIYMHIVHSYQPRPWRPEPRPQSPTTYDRHRHSRVYG